MIARLALNAAAHMAAGVAVGLLAFAATRHCCSASSAQQDDQEQPNATRKESDGQTDATPA